MINAVKGEFIQLGYFTKKLPLQSLDVSNNRGAVQLMGYASGENMTIRPYYLGYPGTIEVRFQ